MMAKMGWKEGQGLGKDMQGRSTYVHVKKKDDNAGLGTDKAHQNNVNDQWYFNAFDSALAKTKIGKKKKKKDKKRKEDKAGVEEEAGTECMYDKMFKATGGARMGMRARAAQNGKLARTEGDVVSATGSDSTLDVAPSTVERLEERRKRKQAKMTGGSDEQETDPVPASVEKEAPKVAVQGSTSVKNRRKIKINESSDGDEDGAGAEMANGTSSKTQKKNKSKCKKSDRADEAARGNAAIDQTTKRKAGKGREEKGRKKKKHTGKGLIVAG